MGDIRIGLRETAWASAAGALQSFGPFASFLILARLASPQELGRYSLAVAVAVPVFLAARMQLRQAAVADPQGASSFSVYRRLRVLAATVSLGALASFALTLQRESCWVLCAVSLLRWTEEVGDIYYAPAQRHGRWTRIAASQGLRLAGALALLWIGWSFAGLPAALLVVALWQTAVTVLFDAPLARTLEPVRLSAIDAGELLRLNWPLGVTAAIVSLISYVPRYALAWSSGESAVGDYAGVAQVALLGNLVVQGAGQATLGRLGIAYAADRIAFRRLVGQLLQFAAAVGVAALLTAALWGDVLLRVVFQPRFAALQSELVIMMAASFFSYVTSVLGYALTAAGVKTGQLAAFGAALAAGLVGAFPLTAAYGILGAAAATACSWAAAAAMAALVLRTTMADGKEPACSTVRSRAV